MGEGYWTRYFELNYWVSGQVISSFPVWVGLFVLTNLSQSETDLPILKEKSLLSWSSSFSIIYEAHLSKKRRKALFRFRVYKLGERNRKCWRMNSLTIMKEAKNKMRMKEYDHSLSLVLESYGEILRTDKESWKEYSSKKSWKISQKSTIIVNEFIHKCLIFHSIHSAWISPSFGPVTPSFANSLRLLIFHSAAEGAVLEIFFSDLDPL